MAYRKRTGRGPFWMKAKYAGSCKTCDASISKGDQVLYNPARRGVQCRTCGYEVALGVRAEESVERFGTDCMLDQ